MSVEKCVEVWGMWKSVGRGRGEVWESVDGAGNCVGVWGEMWGKVRGCKEVWESVWGESGEVCWGVGEERVEVYGGVEKCVGV